MNTRVEENSFFTVLRYWVDNEGSLYVLMYENKFAKGAFPPSYTYKVIKYEAGSRKGTEYVMKLEGEKSISDAVFNVKDNKELVFSGIYAENVSRGLTGIFALLVDFENGVKIKEDTQTVGYNVNGDAADWMYGEQTTKPKTFAFIPEAGTWSPGF